MPITVHTRGSVCKDSATRTTTPVQHLYPGGGGEQSIRHRG